MGPGLAREKTCAVRGASHRGPWPEPAVGGRGPRAVPLAPTLGAMVDSRFTTAAGVDDDAGPASPDSKIPSDPQPILGRTEEQTAEAKAFAVEAATLAADRRCEDVVCFDVRGRSALTDFVVIATGTSDRQMKTVAAEFQQLGRERGFTRYGGEEDRATTWVVADFVQVVVHLFEPETRAHYDLEMLWGDAPTLDLPRGGNTTGPLKSYPD